MPSLYLQLIPLSGEEEEKLREALTAIATNAGFVVFPANRWLGDLAFKNADYILFSDDENFSITDDEDSEGYAVTWDELPEALAELVPVGKAELFPRRTFTTGFDASIPEDYQPQFEDDQILDELLAQQDSPNPA